MRINLKNYRHEITYHYPNVSLHNVYNHISFFGETTFFATKIEQKCMKTRSIYLSDLHSAISH